MARIARVAIPGVPHHITQRGNGRQRIFFTRSDYALYLDLLARYSERFQLRIHAWCLMPNHIHLVATPEGERSMASALGRTHADYARYFNLKRRTSGHVWQARYFSCPLDNRHFAEAMAYVERNPVRARLVLDAQEWAWSSTPSRLGLVTPPLFADFDNWREEYTQERWREVLRSSVSEEAFGRRLAEANSAGRPFGGADCLTSLEHSAGRLLRTRPPGRPRAEISVENGDRLRFRDPASQSKAHRPGENGCLAPLSTPPGLSHA